MEEMMKESNTDKNVEEKEPKGEIVSNFIRSIIDEDLRIGKHKGIITRFPPEPNGYLHIGHAKSICLNFGLARDYQGICHLRFDDTNPSAEDVEYVDSIMEDVRWLGFDWKDKLFYASDYYEQLYAYAEMLINDGKAYICDLNQEEMRAYRGTLTVPGKNSPYRERSVEENLDLFRRMRAGEFEEGTKSLRAKIDMSSPNVNMRDPVIYRIKHAHHHRTGNDWLIYPMYDYTHCISDAIEGITHSICTLEFEDHRPLYDWFLDQLPVPCHPQQIEFARLNLTYTVMSKRILRELVESGLVQSWDDPRMPTIAGLRRRGFTPASIRELADRIGVAKASSIVDYELLQYCVREDLNLHANRAMVVIDPLKVVIDNYPNDLVEEFEADNNAEDANGGKRKIYFSKTIYIEKDDFKEDAPHKWFRLAPGTEVRLKHTYYITCTDVVKDAVTGEITELHCTYDPESRGGFTPDERKIRGTLHWVSAHDAVPVQLRLYDQLFTIPNPMETEEGKTYKDYLNPDSLVTVDTALAEPCIATAAVGDRFQFMRQGYFIKDKDSTPGKPVYNRIVTLKDTWAKIEKKTK